MCPLFTQGLLNMVDFVFLFTGTVFQEAVVGLFPAAVALRAAIGRSVAFPCPLHGAVGAGGRTRAPAGPLIPGSVHWRETEDGTCAGELARTRQTHRPEAWSQLTDAIKNSHDLLKLDCMCLPIKFTSWWTIWLLFKSFHLAEKTIFSS